MRYQISKGETLGNLGCRVTQFKFVVHAIKVGTGYGQWLRAHDSRRLVKALSLALCRPSLVLLGSTFGPRLAEVGQAAP